MIREKSREYFDSLPLWSNTNDVDFMVMEKHKQALEDLKQRWKEKLLLGTNRYKEKMKELWESKNRQEEQKLKLTKSASWFWAHLKQDIEAKKIWKSAHELPNRKFNPV